MTVSQPLPESPPLVKDSLTWPSQSAMRKLVAKITWNTIYSNVKWGEQGGGATRSSTGEFRIIKLGGFMGGALFLHEEAKGWLIPITSVGGLTVKGSASVL